MNLPPKLHVVILAAGKGTRMCSNKPKVLHELAGAPLLAHVINTAEGLAPASINVVVGFKADMVKARLQSDSINWIHQAEQGGTGHAVQCALSVLQFDPGDRILVLLGDVPLLDVASLEPLLDLSARYPLCLLTSQVDNPEGYGRIVRDPEGEVLAIVEQKDADAPTAKIREINTGIMLFDAEKLCHWLPCLDPQNAQGELYLTDVVALAREQNQPVQAYIALQAWRTVGVNDLHALSLCEQQYQCHQARLHQKKGVAIIDPARFTQRGELIAAADVRIDVGCVFEGRVVIEAGARIGPYCVLKDCQIGADSQIEAFSHIKGATVGPDTQVGPYARLRPGTQLDSGSKVGNFVEVKNARLGAGSKANHLSYVGDAVVGADSNLGAGTITCNYDGANKHQTTIGKAVFVGSSVQLIAPVTIHDGATIAAGSTISRDVPANALGVARSRQQHRENWRRPLKK